MLPLTLIFCFLSSFEHALADVAKPWMDPSLPVPQRVEMVLAAMTQTDKINQLLRGDGAPSQETFDNGIGLLEMGPLLAEAKNASHLAYLRNEQQRSFLTSGLGKRLGVPASYRQLAIHGTEAFGVIFPEGPGIGATWDVDLVRDMAAAIAIEARAIGADMNFFVIHMIADARFGRQEEGFSEEPTLTANMAAAAVLGSHGMLGLPADEVGFCHLSDCRP